MTQNNLGNALSDQAERMVGAEATRLLAEAAQAYRQSLTVYSREQLPQQWAATQNNLSGILQNQAAHATGIEAKRLLAEAAQAYRQILTVYTREQLPQGWAMTQNNLGVVLRDQAEHTEGAEAITFFAEAAKAYREALTIYTRERQPQQWAMLQNNLGGVLTSQAERVAETEASRLFSEAVQAFRQALTVRTREQMPQQWATTQSNLGVTLRTQAERLGGETKPNLLREAVAAFELALQVRQRETLPQGWLRTQNSLAKTYFLLGEWENAALAYANVLSMLPNDAEGLEQLSGINHEKLYQLAEAFALNERRVKLDSNDLSAQSAWAENYFTTARFAEAETRLAALIANPKLDADQQTALRVIEIANALALGKAESVKPKLAALSAAVAQQPADFRVGWSFNGTLHFIGTHEPLTTRRDWLRQLIGALQAENRDAMLTALRAAEKEFKP
ncbi:MAG: tetratricopeptide repeat protein [Acidobacteria bacterium]|nr:tetratricopeptide repeat protein [Acidobacteriota bacterium]